MKIHKWFQRNIDSKLILVLALFYTLFDILHILKFFWNWNFNGSSDPNFSATQFILDYILDWLIVLAFMTYIAVSTKKLLEKKIPWKKIFILHLALSLFLGIIIQMIFDAVYSATFGISGFSLSFSINRIISVMDYNYLIYTAMVGIIYSFYYMKQVKETEAQKSLLAKQLLDSKVKILNSQLQPHFLFNTLNCVSSLISFDQKQAQDTLADLSEFFREVFKNSESNLIPLRKELEILDLYLSILKVRFSEDLFINKEIEHALLHEHIPAFLLQPIIENSVFHGYSNKHLELRITISIYSDKENIIMSIRNNGKYIENFETTLNSGFGLFNLRERLQSIYQSNFSFEMKNSEIEQGVETLITIPKI